MNQSDKFLQAILQNLPEIPNLIRIADHRGTYSGIQLDAYYRRNISGMPREWLAYSAETNKWYGLVEIQKPEPDDFKIRGPFDDPHAAIAAMKLCGHLL